MGVNYSISADIEVIPASVWVRAWKASTSMGLKQGDTTCDVVDGHARLLCRDVVIFKVESKPYLGLSKARVHDSLWAMYVNRAKRGDDNLLRSLRIAPLNHEAGTGSKTVTTE